MPRPTLPADPDERAAAKSALLRDAETGAPANARFVGRQITYNGITATLTEAPVVDQYGRLVLVVQAWRASDNLELDVDNPLIYVNPPVLVRDPAGDIVVTDSNGTETRFRYDALAALQEIVWATLERFLPEAG